MANAEQSAPAQSGPTAAQIAGAAAAGVASVVAVAAVTDPKAAAAVQVAATAISMLQQAQALATAGAMTPEQLAALWSQTGAGVQKAHDQWKAANGTGV